MDTALGQQSLTFFGVDMSVTGAMRFQPTQSGMEPRFDPNPATLVCFPHAGADAIPYRGFAQAVSAQEGGHPGLRVEVVNFPGRGRRHNEPLLTDFGQLADDAFKQVSPWIGGGRYALFGHSMGAWLAYLTARRIHAQRLPPPFRLIVSAARPPRLGVRKRLHELDRPSLVAELERMGGFPRELLANTDALDYYLPILRADFEAMAGYQADCQAEQESAFDIPITVFRGTMDTIGREDALAWGEETKAQVDLREFAGNHFFVLNQAGEVARLTRQILLESA